MTDTTQPPAWAVVDLNDGGYATYPFSDTDRDASITVQARWHPHTGTTVCLTRGSADSTESFTLDRGEARTAAALLTGLLDGLDRADTSQT